MIESIILAFIPIFVAIDPFGTIPLFTSLTQGFSYREKRKLAFQAILTAFIFGLIFILFGKFIFQLLGITTSDFQIAGGLLLIIFSVQEIFGQASNKPTGEAADNFIGIVPLGIPVIAGPALITTLLILQEQHPFGVTLLALALNLVFTFIFYLFSDQIILKLGEATPKVTAKVFAIFLAAIGIMMIRKGLETAVMGLVGTG